MATPALQGADDFDLAIVGAGMVGASIAYHAAPHARVLLLEAEPVAGYHASGRSAALFAESYGPPNVRALTRASRAFFELPPAGFSTHPLLRARGALMVAGPGQREQARALHAVLRAEGAAAQWLEGPAVRDRVPVLRPEASVVAVLDAEAFDIDVDALLQGYLRAARAAGAVFEREARVAPLARTSGRWHLQTTVGRRYGAATIVDAAGAWADEVAARCGVAPVGLVPRRRTAFLFTAPEGVDTRAWPAVIAVDESWYFKPDAGLLLGSPANADPVPAHDVVPEELDVAQGIARIEEATTMTIRRPKRAWAGLRSFVTDGEPVAGFEPGAPGFLWAAALGGYGIQTSPAFGRLCAALALGQGVPADIARHGLALDALAPRRASLGRA
jgi:D-arginine dehydrogenase